MLKIGEEIKHYINEYIATWQFSGAICVMKDGVPLIQEAYGMACYEFNIPNTMDTCFSLASVSKQFTAFAVMQLYEKGLIDIDVPVNRYLPENLRIDDRITAHHLMSHTSGLRNFYTFEDDMFQVYDRSNYSKQDYFNRFINQPLSSEPGTKYEYCNSGYNMLAWLVEEVSGENFGEYLRKNIFLPLDMQSTVLDDSTNIIKNKAYLYQVDRDDVVRCPYYNEKFSKGAGGLVSNCTDMYKWYQCLKNRRLLAAETYKRYFSVNSDGYCYGICHDEKNGRSRYCHGGDHLGIQSYVQYLFEEDIFIIILSNNDFGNQYRIGDAINDIIFSVKAKVPARLPEIELDEELAARYEGVYLDKKIELRRNNGNWEFVRYNGNLHISLYPVGKHQFSRKWYDQFNPYTLKECDDGTFEFFGFRKS